MTDLLDNYNAMRAELVTGDVLVCNGKDVSAVCIKTLTSKKGYQQASHVATIIVIKEFDRVMISESVINKGVRFIRLSKYLKNYDNKGNAYTGFLSIFRHEDYQYHPNLEKKLVKFVFDNLGRDYSKRQILSLLFRLITKKMPIRIIEKHEEYICSEFCDVGENILNLFLPKKSINQIALPCDFTAKPYKLLGELK